MMRKVALFMIFALIFQACHKPEASDKKVFRYNESSGISSLDPAFARNQANIWAVNQLFNGLVQLDDKLQVKPAIASSWEVADHGRTYIFHLRQDVFFHQDTSVFPKTKNRKVTAPDFVYSFNRIVSSDVASPGAWVFSKVENSEGKYAFEALNDSILTIKLSQPFPPFLGLLSMQYCSVIPHEAIEKYGKDFRKHPVGTGPFQFKMWKEGVKLVLVKNENYFEFDQGKRLPYLDAVSITFIVDKQSVFLEFVKGNLDFMSGIDASYKDELLTREGKLNPKYAGKFTLTTEPYLNTEYLGFNIDVNLPDIKKSPTSEILIRKAINCGFDRKKMMRYLRNNIGIPGLYGFVPPGLPSFDSTLVKGYAYDPDLARKYLQQAGFPGGRGLAPITLSTNASYLDLATYIQQQLNELGFDIRIDMHPPASLREMMAQSKIPFFRGSWIADYPDAENYLSVFYSPNFSPKGPNYTHFSNQRFDELMNASQLEMNDSVRYAMYREMDNIMLSEAPVVILYYDQVLRFTQNNIIDLGSNPLNLLNLKKVHKN